MAFRDDTEALLARLEAAENEAAEARELHERVKELEGENRETKQELAKYHARDKRRLWWKNKAPSFFKRIGLVAGVALPICLVSVAGYFMYTKADARARRAEAALLQAQRAQEEEVRRLAEEREQREAEQAAAIAAERYAAELRAREAGVRQEHREPDPAELEAANERRSKSLVCAGILQCRIENKAYGTFNDRIIADISTDGSIKRVRYQGDAPAKARGCMIKAVRGREIDGYTGSKGRVTCLRSGTLLPGSKMIMSDSTFERLE